MRVKNLSVLIVAFLSAGICFLAPATSASDPGTGDWPMWGGTPDRNMVSNMKGLPTTWDVKTKKNIKWVAQLGSQTFGNVVVSGGMVFIGTNNEGVRDPKVTGDKGVLMAFRESDGQFMWQMVHDKLATGRVNDWPYQGIASSPLVDGNRIYYVSNRAELMCLDTQGFHDGKNDGVQDEVRKGRLDLRQHVERSGRKSRQHSFAESAGNHRRQQEHRQTRLGRQLRLRSHSARPMVVADCRHDRRRGPTRTRTGRRLDPRLRSAHRQEAVGV